MNTSQLKEARLCLSALGVNTSLMTDDEIKQITTRISNSFIDAYKPFADAIQKFLQPLIDAAQHSADEKLRIVLRDFKQ